ncbi:MAG: sulfite exporter TauE/SafE family protein [Mastigocoleus sp.]
MLFLAALVAGAVNGIAGGGGLIVFPTLVFLGLPPVYGNTSNKNALWFGTFASTVAYRREFSGQYKTLLFILTEVSILGGILGSYLLLNIPPVIFSNSVPYLMLIASFLFAFKFVLKRFLWKYFKFIHKFLIRDSLITISLIRKSDSSHSILHILVIILLQLIITTYSGFFGGGAGILILGILSFAGVENINQMNAYKSWLVTCTNGIAIINLSWSNTIVWNYVTIIAAGAWIGGYGSAYIARKINTKWINYFIIGISLTLSIYLLFR